MNRFRAALSCALFLAAAPACRPSRAATQEDASPAATPVRVVTAPVVSRDLSFTITRVGSVAALESVDLFAKVSGYLERIDADIGDEVESGQVLATLDVPELELELKRLEAELELARHQAQREASAVSEARSQVAVAEADRERLASARRAAEAELELRRSELERWTGLVADSPAIEARKVDEARYRFEAAKAVLTGQDDETAAAEARVAAARAAVERASADEEVARARIAVAEAALDEGRAQARYTRVEAPFDGVVTARFVHPGAFIRSASSNSAAGPLLTVQRVDRVRVAADLPMDCLAELDTGDPAVFANVASSPSARFRGAITRMAGALGERSRMMRVEVELENPAGADGRRPLRPGDYGDLTLTLAEYPGTPTVPAAAVFTRDGHSSVLVVEDGSARRREVEVVYRDGQSVGVSRGLSPGEQVILTGPAELADGQRVLASEEAR